MLLGWPSEQSMNGKSKIKGALDVPIQKTKGIIVNHVQDLAILTIMFLTHKKNKRVDVTWGQLAD